MRYKILALAACLLISVMVMAQDRLPDGIYRVTEVYGSRPDILPPGQTLVNYSYRMVDSSAQSFRFVAVDPVNYVSLVLAKDPDRQIQKDDRSHLLLTLTRKASRQLKRLTRRYTGERVSIVIDGEAVTMHRVREAITGGLLQITRCTDNACAYLFFELRDNVR